MDFMMETLLNFLIAFLLLFKGSKVHARDTTEEDYEVYANQIVCSFARDMEEEFGLLCVGEGGCMPHDVQEMRIEFIAYQRGTIEEARELMVIVTERFIEAINAHKKIRPFLREYPVQPFRARVAISFKKKNNHSYTDGSVGYVFQGRNKICYRKRDSSTPTGLVSLLEEPYDEALRIVQNK